MLNLLIDYTQKARALISKGPSLEQRPFSLNMGLRSKCQTLRIPYISSIYTNLTFFATGPGMGLIMYILTTLEFPTHNFDFHLLTTSVNAKYYY